MNWAKLGQKIWEWRGVMITTPSVAVLLLAMRFAGLLQPAEWAAFDQYFQWRPLETQDNRIVIVGINEADLKKVGQIPVPDVFIARLLEKIKAQKPRAIGLDLYRDLPVQPGNQELLKVFETTPNLIGIEKKVEDKYSSAIAPPPELKRREQVGANDVVVDADGKLRRGLLFLTTSNGESIASLGLMLAFIYLEAEKVTPRDGGNGNLQLGKTVFIPFEKDDGAYVDADAGGYQILLNYRGSAGSFTTVSLSDVLENRIAPDLMRDRIVLVGPTATSLNDFIYTPYSSGLVKAPQRTPGVEIQANLTSQIVSSALDGRTAIKTWADPVECIWIFAWSSIGAILSWSFRLTRYTSISILLAGVILVSGSYFLFLSGWWIPVVPPALALLGSAISITGYIASIEREDRQTVMNLFGRHVTPQIAEAIWRDRHELLKEGRLLGRKMTATVLFTDLKDFSSLAERDEPETLMSWLNEYMEAMTKIVLDHGGVVDKFIGDSIMAVFGVPIARTTEEAIAQDAQQAVDCAVAMASTLETLNQQWQTQNRPTTAMRVGISTGTVLIGSLGSSQRVDYTTVGDSVNVASRLESYDKSLDGGLCRILINEQTYVYTQGKFNTKFIGSVLLKGRQQPAKIYQVLFE
jgi:adenylate cyclase